METEYQLKWTDSAKDDLVEIITYIQKDRPVVAKEVYEKIKKIAHSSNLFPLKGRIVPELEKEGMTFYRELISKPWRIIYKVGKDRVYIMAIIDSRQNLEDILLKKLLRSS